MNFITHFNRFYARLSREPRFNSRHISLYLALFHCWNNHRFENPFPLIRERVMQLSGLRSKDSYMRCLKELHVSGYIIYSPALNKYHRPKVSMLSLAPSNGIEPQLPLFSRKDENSPGAGPENRPGKGTATVPDSGAVMVKIGTAPVPDSGHYNKTNLNNVNRERETHAQNLPLKTDQEGQTGTPRAAASLIPSREEVSAHFKQLGYPETEATLFYSHYKAIDWKMGGKAPITDWQSAAEKWIELEKKIKHQSNENQRKLRGNENLHVQRDTDYSEPL